MVGISCCLIRGHVPGPSAEAGSRRYLPLVGQELPVQRHDDTVTSWVGHTLDVEAEVDGTHDAVAALLVDEFFECRTVDLEQSNA